MWRGAPRAGAPPLLALLAAVALLAGAGAEELDLDAIMPPYEANHRDAYLCTTVPLPDRQLKLIGIEPLSKQDVVHHMLLFGCKEPASREPVFDCLMKSACAGGGESVLYGWGKNAPKMALPEGTGFSVGKGTGITSLVLQVHYLNPRPANDTSGVRLRLGDQPVEFSAGMVAYAAGFTVPARRASYLVPNECCYTGFEALRGFAFRVHTHALGREVYLQQAAGKAVGPADAGDGAGGGDGDSPRAPRIAAQDPQRPQGFYPLDPQPLILPGDRLRMTCDFNSSASRRAVSAGHTSSHEMCNLYLMAYARLPFFMWCLDSGEYTELGGPGGLAAKGRLVPETAEWKPPARVDAAGAAGGGSVPVGQVAGVATAADDPSVWVLHRGEVTWTGASFDAQDRITAAAPIAGPMVLRLEADSGAVLAAWGSDTFYMPHMITPDYEGNVWVTDVGLHQAIKFSAAGEKLLELGTRLTPGSGPAAFCKPTQVAVGRDGSVYVADGYCNSRVARFNASGAWQRDYSMPEGEGAMGVPHSVVVAECRGRLVVADREGGAVHAFDLDSGRLEGTWALGGTYGLPYSLAMGPYGTVLALTWDRESSGRVTVVALGGDPGRIEADWEVPGAEAPHDLALAAAPLSASGVGERLLAVLVAETRPAGSRLLKFVVAPQGMETPAEQAAGAEEEAGEEEVKPAALAASHVHDTKLRRIGGGDTQQQQPEKAHQGGGSYASVLGKDRGGPSGAEAGGEASAAAAGGGAEDARASADGEDEAAEGEARLQQQRQQEQRQQEQRQQQQQQQQRQRQRQREEEEAGGGSERHEVLSKQAHRPGKQQLGGHGPLLAVLGLVAAASAAFLALRRRQAQRGYHAPQHGLRHVA